MFQNIFDWKVVLLILKLWKILNFELLLFNNSNNLEKTRVIVKENFEIKLQIIHNHISITIYDIFFIIIIKLRKFKMYHKNIWKTFLYSLCHHSTSNSFHNIFHGIYPYNKMHTFSILSHPQILCNNINIVWHFVVFECWKLFSLIITTVLKSSHMFLGCCLFCWYYLCRFLIFVTA